jgi:hypothetical protein
MDENNPFIDDPNPDDDGENFEPPFDPEKMDELVQKINDRMAKVGLYDLSVQIITVPDDGDLHRLGIHSYTDDPQPLILAGTYRVGDLAWERLKTEKQETDDILLRMEMAERESEMDAIRKKYTKESDSDDETGTS